MAGFGAGNTGNVSSIPGVPCDVANDGSLAEHAEAVREVLDADLMPPSPPAPLPEDEKDALFGWLEAGVPHTTGPCE